MNWLGGGGTCLLMPALGGRVRWTLWVPGQPGLQGEFQNSQSCCYTEKPCLEKNKNKKRKQNKNEWIEDIIHAFLKMTDFVHSWCKSISAQALLESEKSTTANIKAAKANSPPSPSLPTTLWGVPNLQQLCHVKSSLEVRGMAGTWGAFQVCGSFSSRVL